MVPCHRNWAARSTKARELRAEGDYGTGTPDAEDVAAFLAQAEAFIAAVKAVISDQSPASSA